jgi:glutamate decarboxylase
MVHLNRVVTDAEIKEEGKGLVNGFKAFKIDGVEEEEDDFTATVYGSKYAAEDLPRHDMPVCCSAWWYRAKC